MIKLIAPCQKTNYIFSLTIRERETKYPSTDAQYTQIAVHLSVERDHNHHLTHLVSSIFPSVCKITPPALTPSHVCADYVQNL